MSPVWRILLGVVVGALALTGCIGNGIHRVGSPMTSEQMAPGLWRSLGGEPCSWARIGPGPQIRGRSSHAFGPQYAQVEPGDIGFTVDSCFPFWQQPGAFARPVVQPGQPFGDGDFLVGSEVAPGTYVATAPPGPRCTWAVVRGFHGTDASGRNPDVIRGTSSTAGGQTAVVGPGDFGFTSEGCGQWLSSSPRPPAPGGASTSAVLTGGKVEDFPDPFVLRVDDPTGCAPDPAPCYYAYATESGFLGLNTVPIVRSTDLTTWEWAGTDGNAMPVSASWVQFGANWAPSVLLRPSNPVGQRYVMYYTAKSLASSPYAGAQCIGIATSASPNGPFVDTSTAPALCQPALGGTIDPSPFVAAGSAYLAYANDAGLFARPLNTSGTGFVGGEHQLLDLGGGYPWDSTRIEGPTMLTTPTGGLELLYSAGHYATPTYSVGAATCDTPLGPCHRTYSTPALEARGAMLGPGGESAFQLPDNSWVLAFHAWDGAVGYEAEGLRSLHFLPLTFPGGNPAVG